jgi:hypothetical protein
MNVLNNNLEEKTNTSNLNLLSIFYFVFGGLSLMVAFIMLIYGIVINVIFSNQHVQDAINSEPEGEIVGSVFGIISIVFLVAFILVLVIGILQIIAGFRLRQKRSRSLIIVVAVLELLSFPLGTALGVFTIVVLSKPSVIDMFNNEEERRRAEIYGNIG